LPLREVPEVVPRRTIDEYAQMLAQQLRPERIILFGSHASGAASTDSDVDLLVVISHTGTGVEKAAEIRSRFRTGFPMDLIVRSPQSLRKRLEMGDCFLKEVVERGQVLYEAADKRVD
jgi:predicted nucleotidyltransferase